MSAGLLKNEPMITSSYSTVKEYLEDQLLLGHSGDNGDNDSSDGYNKNVGVIGSNGLCDEIEKFGFHVKSWTNMSINEDDNNDDNHAMDRMALASYSFESIENFDDNNSSSSSLS